MWDTHWSPTLHCLGILVHGVCEMYMISNADCPKDSNMQMSALTWALDLSQEILAKRGLALPLHLVVQCDNTCREGRNQWLFLWCSEMVASGRFNSISPIFSALDTRISLSTGDSPLSPTPCQRPMSWRRRRLDQVANHFICMFCCLCHAVLPLPCCASFLLVCCCP
jgi:hypothetical protein